MPVSKLNVLHWHLVDDESFPLELQSHPELAQYGKYDAIQHTVDGHPPVQSLVSD